MSFRETGVNSTEKAFNDQMVTIINPSDRQLLGQWDGEVFVINPKSEEQVPMWLGKHFVRHFGIIDGQPCLQLVENIKVTCGLCQKQFNDRRELGAHSLSHRKDN
jgi:hypothetical protein